MLADSRAGGSPSYDEMRELLWEYLEVVITLLASEYSSASGQSGPSSSAATEFSLSTVCVRCWEVWSDDHRRF